MRHWTWLGLFALAAVPVAVAEQSWDARLTRVEGKVSVEAAGASSDEAVPGEADMPLADGDRIVTGSDGRAEIALDPERVLELGPGSDLTIESIAHEESVFRLALGYLAAKLEAFQKRRYKVQAPNIVAAVRGTEFAVEVSAGEELTAVAGVFGEGRLAVTASDGTEETLLGPGEEAERVGRRPLGKARKMAFLLKRAERIRAVAARRAALRERFKNFGPEDRKRSRRRLLERRQEKKGERKDRRENLHDRRDDRRDRRDERGGRGGRRGGRRDQR